MDRKQNVLLVDDDVACRDMFKTVLEKEGYVVEIVANGVEALKKLAERDYQVLLLDLMMPKMDGMEVLKRMHHQAKATQLARTVVMTNLSQDAVKKKIEVLGVKKLYDKSAFDPTTLIDMVKSVG